MLTLLQNKVGKNPPLSARLSAIAESLPQGAFVCDIGSDHGALPIYLLDRGVSDRVIVTDLNEKPLARARKALSDAGLLDRATLLLTDGIEDVLKYSPDAFVIAGMGGETIAGILERGLAKIPKGTFFALQPMSKPSYLRSFLYRFGFLIENERIVKENGKFFWIMLACYDGVERKIDPDVDFLGKFLPGRRDSMTLSYFSDLLTRTEKQRDGKRKAGISCEAEEKRILLLREWTEACHEDL